MRRVFLAALLTACGHAAVAPTAPRLDGPIADRSTPDADFRGKPPEGAALGVPSANIEERRLKNGIRVLFVERHDAPILSVNIVSDRGGDQADAGIPEFWRRATMVASEKYKYWEVNELMNGLGAAWSAHVTPDSTEVRVTVLSKLLEPTMDLVSDLIEHPSFPPSRVTLARQRMRAGLESSYATAEGQLLLAIHRALYPAGHRYHDGLVPPESIDKVTPEILEAYQHFAFTPEHMTLAVAGDTTLAVLLPILESAFGTHTGPKVGPQAPVAPPPEPEPNPRFIVMDQPSGSQAHVAAVWLGAPTTIDDRFPYLLALEALENETFVRLRVKLGITYGAQLFGEVGRSRRPIGVASAVELDRAVDAAKALVEITDRLATAPLSAEDLDDGKTALIGAATYFDSISSTASSLAGFAVYGRPLDYPKLRAAAVRACEAEAVRNAAERWLNPSRMRIIIVGDAARIVPGLQKLSLGKVLRSPPFKL